jgi:ketosteroid isomerase-like protein
MTPRELFDRAMAAINSGDAEALLALYAPDAVQVGYDGTVVGREALRPQVREWLAGRPAVAEVAYADGADTIVFEASDGQTHGYGTLVLRDGLIWRETVGVIAAGGTTAAVRSTAPPVELEPYRAWAPRTVPDPRTAGRDALMPAVLEIVEAEGPILAGRAFGLYTRAAGGKKLTGAAKAPLTGATWRLKIAERVEIARAGATTIENDDVLRAAGSPPVRVRELGPRTLEEVPLDEVAALMDRLQSDPARPAAALKRAVLDVYGLTRLTARADEYLEQALDRTAEASGR